MKTITVKNGPLHGTTQDVSDDAATFTHHADPNGYYKVNETATRQTGRAPATPYTQAN